MSSNPEIPKSPSHQISRILLVRLREIGDVVFTTPAVQALRQHFPVAHLTYVVEPAAAPIVVHNPHLDRVLIAKRLPGPRGLAADFTFGRQLRADHYDLAIDFHGGPRAALLTWLSGAPARIGYASAARGWTYTIRVAHPRALRPRHSVENQWDLLAPLGIAPPDRSRFPVTMIADPAIAASVEARLAREGVGATDVLIVVHVSAGNPFRRWPFEHFVALVTTMAARDPGRRILITAGPSEGDAAERVIEGARARLREPGESEKTRPASVGAWDPAQQVLSCGEFSLVELRALFDRASLYIGGDSGPLHVAATTKVPIVGVYGPTLPARSAPWRDPRFTCESVDAGELPCRPCDQRVCEPGDFRCLTRVTPEQVARAAETALLSHGVRP